MEYVRVFIVEIDVTNVGSTTTVRRYTSTSSSSHSPSQHATCTVFTRSYHTLTPILYLQMLLTLALHPTNPPYRPILLTHLINPPYHPILSPSGAITLFETIRDMPGNYSIYCTFQCNNDHDCVSHDVMKPVVVSPRGSQHPNTRYITHSLTYILYHKPSATHPHTL